jgi:hypothetical protein
MGRLPISHAWADFPYMGRLPINGKTSLTWEKSSHILEYFPDIRSIPI